MAINEVTLEARINGLLFSVFPTFKNVKVEHQKSFSIKFGHHNVTVDLKEPSTYPSRAIFDILLTVDDRNAILLELKREGLPLTHEDVEQGLSYARLIHPMPPLTLISNGTENQFYDTYTKERSDVSSVDLNLIQEKINDSFKLATNDFRDAVNTLLNKEPELFSQVINQISKKRFERYCGPVEDFTKPICPDFLINRKVISNIQDHFSNNEMLVGIIGSAFSGKTNLLYEFFMHTNSNNSFLLFIDCGDHNYSILQQLANHFTENTKFSVDKNKIREWLLFSLGNLPDSKFYLLLDNFNKEMPEAIMSEVIELIDIFKGINQHTLYTIDEFNYEEIAYHANRRYKTIIGEKSKILALDELDDDEFHAANHQLFEKYKVVIEHGGHFTPEYRQLRILRHLIAIWQSNDMEEDRYSQIQAVPDLRLLQAISKNKTYTKGINDLYCKMASCFILEHQLRKKNPELSIMASGSGAITRDSFKKEFPEDYTVLIKSSVVVLRELRNGLVVIYPKIHELVAIHTIDIVTSIIITSYHKGKTIKEMCSLLIDIVTPIPYCDIVATGILLQLANKNEVDLFSQIVQELLTIPPHLEKIGSGTKVLMYTEDLGHVQINIEDDLDEGGMVADFLPYVILSQLAGYPLSLVDNKEYSQFAFHLSLIYTVGSTKHFIRRADATSIMNIMHFDSYDWEDVGEFVCGKEGIIEPIVQSIQKCFFVIPDEIEILYSKAFEENNFILLYRIYLALREIVGITDSILSKKAEDFVERFNEYFDSFMAEYLTREIENPEERETARRKLLSLKDKCQEKE